jgi:hypothetical protein
MTGSGVDKDYKKAMEFFISGAEAGDKYSNRNIAILYEDGFGVPKNPSKAFEFGKKAGNTLLLGRYYECGIGTEIDTKKAFTIYTDTRNQLISLMQRSRGLLADRLYRVSDRLIRCHELGIGTKVDPLRAVTVALDTAELIKPWTIRNYEIIGPKYRWRKMIKYYISAAESYEMGKGVDINYANAHALYTKAAKYFSAFATKKLLTFRKTPVFTFVGANKPVGPVGLVTVELEEKHSETKETVELEEKHSETKETVELEEKHSETKETVELEEKHSETETYNQTIFFTPDPEPEPIVNDPPKQKGFSKAVAIGMIALGAIIGAGV